MNTPTVLIADNDRAVSSLLTDVLVRAGLRVRHAYDGEEARTMAQAGGCKVLVCDLDMPKLSGLEVLEALADSASPPFALCDSRPPRQWSHGPSWSAALRARRVAKALRLVAVCRDGSAAGSRCGRACEWVPLSRWHRGVLGSAEQ